MEKLVPKLGTKWIKLYVSIIVNILINSCFSDGTSGGAEIETVYWSYWHISKDYRRLEIQKPKCYNNKRKEYIISLYCLASVNEPLWISVVVCSHAVFPCVDQKPCTFFRQLTVLMVDMICCDSQSAVIDFIESAFYKWLQGIKKSKNQGIPCLVLLLILCLSIFSLKTDKWASQKVLSL